MTDDRVQITVVVTPRERYGVALHSLQSIYDRTTTPFRLIYVNGGGPRALRRRLRAESVSRGFTLVQTPNHLSPNQARNLGLARVDTPYVVFVDNDLVVSDRWLEHLLVCARQTGAALVGPLYFEGDPADRIIHMAGGECDLNGPFGNRTFSTVHRLQGVSLDKAPELERQPVDFIEFHCMLARTSLLKEMGGLDEQLLSTREHLDLCLAVVAAGESVFFEPQSEVTYTTPPPVELSDVPFYLKRWSEAWNRASLEHFCRKHGIEASYVDRLVGMRARRQILLAPARNVLQHLPAGGARFTTRVMERLERELNGVLVRTPSNG